MIRVLSLLLAMVLSTGFVRAEEPLVPVFDLHCDVLYRMSGVPFDLVDAPDYISVSIPTMEQGGVNAQVFALWVHSKNKPGMEGAQDVFGMIDQFYTQAEKHRDRIALATSMREAEAIRASGRTPIFLIIEGGGPIAGDLAMLRTYHRLGVRGMTLTWMNNLEWAGSSTDEENPNMGLTDHGREIVREMNRLGWLVDLSHVSDQTFYDAVEVSTDPVIISHSGCRALFDHPRNVTDDMLRALSKNGGVIGIVSFTGYLDPEWEAAWDEAEASIHDEIAALLAKYDGDTSNPEYRHKRQDMIQAAIPPKKRTTLDAYLDHLAHAIEVAGPDHVALGSDFDGIWANAEGFATAADWQEIAQGLRDRGYGEDVVGKVMHGNAERVFRQVMDK